MRDSTESYVIVIPALDEWESLRILLPLLDRALASASLTASVLIVDDGSEVPAPLDIVADRPVALSEVAVLHLRRNLGHQRAIAVGLAYVVEHQPCSAVVVMDADGEDRAEDVPRLIAALLETGPPRAVFAKRLRRSEGVVFTVSYRFYCLMHRILTGLQVEVGNFSVVPFELVRKLGTVAEMWNHYAAAVVRARIARKLVPADRGTRLAGHSRMNFVSLVTHGLSAMSVFADRIAVRLLAGSAVLALFAISLSGAVLVLRIRSATAVPNWMPNTVGLLDVLFIECIVLSLVFAVAVQVARSSVSFLPERDYHLFVDTRTTLYSR